MSILERSVQNLNEENEPDFRLVINANVSDLTLPRRYNATAANKVGVSIMHGIFLEVTC